MVLPRCDLLEATGLSGLALRAVESEGLALDQPRARYPNPNRSGSAGPTASAATAQPCPAAGEAAPGVARGPSASPCGSPGPFFATSY